MLKNTQVTGGVVIAGFLAIFALMGPTSAGSLFANTASAGYGGSNSASKVTICHNGNTIKVAKSAVSAHTKHGDTKGACSSTSSTLPKVSSPLSTVSATLTVETKAKIQELNIQLLSLLQQLLALMRTQQ